jgi:hypothetical protein
MAHRSRRLQRLPLPWDKPHPIGQLIGHSGDVASFEACAAKEQGIVCSAAGERGVDDPAVGLDPGAAEVVLQLGRLLNRSLLGQADNQDAREPRVLQLHERGGDMKTAFIGEPDRVAMVGARGVE